MRYKPEIRDQSVAPRSIVHGCISSSLERGRHRTRPGVERRQGIEHGYRQAKTNQGMDLAGACGGDGIDRQPAPSSGRSDRAGFRRVDGAAGRDGRDRPVSLCQVFFLPVVCLARRRRQPAGPVGQQPGHQPVSDAGGIDHDGCAVLAQLRRKNASIRSGTETAQAKY